MASRSDRSPINRSCDHCRRRKVKCDSTSPCSNCRISKLSCSYAVPPKKRGPKFRTRSGHQGRTPQEPSPAQETTRHPVSPPEQQETIPSISPTSTLISNIAPSPHFQTFEQRQERFEGPQNGIRPSLISIHEHLVSSIGEVLPHLPMEKIVETCLDLYMQYLFPLMPLIHEASARNYLALLRREAYVSQTVDSPYWVDTAENLDTGTRDLSSIRHFTLLTAFCADTAFVLPSDLFPWGHLIASHFLRASRQALNLYHDIDIEDPDSTSLIIRYLHTNSTHAEGKTRVSWHLLGECLRLAQEMRLYDSTLLDGLDPVEAQLLQNIFWQLYTGDKSAALLNDRSFALHQFNVRKLISLPHSLPGGHSLLDTRRSPNSELFESQLMAGFHKCQEIWNLAFELLLSLQRIEQSGPTPQSLLLTPEEKSKITEAYLRYLSTLDDLPMWYRNPGTFEATPNKDQVYRNRCFSAQRANLQVTYHCLKLIILDAFSGLGLSPLLGIMDDALMITLRKIEIAQDVINFLQEVPFESLQANGEPCVEKIRQVGANLLQIMQTIGNAQIGGRAELYFTTLLDILTKLDSKASDSLHQARG
ncbi:hypothetical protein V8E51_010598 [Hyaloscypha variabilis]